MAIMVTSSSFSKEAATAPLHVPAGFRWWRVIPPANLVHLAIGGVYVYSMWTPGMTQALGVIAPTASDWTIGSVLPVFSAGAVCLGVTTSRLGQWVEQVGPRTSALVGSVFWSTALVTAAAGVHFHSLPVVYLGFSLFGGVGWAFMYLAPVTTVMKWFPDRRGLATGIALSAFGAGAAVAPSIIHTLIDSFSVAPNFIGPLPELTHGLEPDQYVTLKTLTDGTQVVADSSAVGVPAQEVVVATSAQASHFSAPAGAYELGTGNTGIAPAMATLGALYGVAGALGARFMHVPHPDWKPNLDSQKHREEDIDNLSVSKRNAMEEHNVGLTVEQAMKTRQFPLLWLTVFGNATGGLALLSSSKLMMGDIWTTVAPDLVTASFATAYVSGLGIGMAAGRFGWSALSDHLGRKNTYALFGLGIPIVGLAPAVAHSAVSLAAQDGGTTTSSILPYVLAFCGGSALSITFYGGVFSVLPAYIADLFGQKNAGAIHGKLLTAWAASAVAGPTGLAYLRQQSVNSAIFDLIAKVEDPASFENFFGCSVNNSEAIQSLVDAKTITIARLMQLVPPSTLDPTPHLYDSTFMAAASLMSMAFAANLLIGPINKPPEER